VKKKYIVFQNLLLVIVMWQFKIIIFTLRHSLNHLSTIFNSCINENKVNMKKKCFVDSSGKPQFLVSL